MPFEGTDVTPFIQKYSDYYENILKTHDKEEEALTTPPPPPPQVVVNIDDQTTAREEQNDEMTRKKMNKRCHICDPKVPDYVHKAICTKDRTKLLQQVKRWVQSLEQETSSSHHETQ